MRTMVHECKWWVVCQFGLYSKYELILLLRPLDETLNPNKRFLEEFSNEEHFLVFPAVLDNGRYKQNIDPELQATR